MSILQASNIQGDVPAAATKQGMVDRKELSAFAFQRTRMPMVVSDARQPDYPIVLANDAFLELTGYDAEDIGRNCRFLQGEATSRTAVAQIRAAVAQQREATIEVLNYKKDGTPFWNQLHISPLGKKPGTWHIISDRKSMSPICAVFKLSKSLSIAFFWRSIIARRMFWRSLTVSYAYRVLTTPHLMQRLCSSGFKRFRGPMCFYQRSVGRKWNWQILSIRRSTPSSTEMSRWPVR